MDGWVDGRTDGQTDRHTDRQIDKQISAADLEPAHVEEILQKREDRNVEVAAHFQVTEILSTNQRADEVEIDSQRDHL